MDIGVHLTNGQSHWFRQTDPQIVSRMILHLSPKRVFNHPQVLIEGIHSTRGINTQFIEAIELIIEPVEEWQNLPGMNITAVSKETFREKIKTLRPDVDAKGLEAVGQQLGSIWMVSERNFHLSIQAENQSALDQLKSVQNFFTSGAQLLNREDGGYMIINMTNAVRWTLTPGPKNLPADSWVASKLE
jgi:hypothetical protein